MTASGRPSYGALAELLQEPFTVAVRLRSNRQVAPDSQQFRQHVKALLARADSDARAAGFSGEASKLALYAFVAFLDESVLRSPQAIFRDWAGHPLQVEVFGDHLAGENFYRNLGEVMRWPDSPHLADLLEVHLLCLLLGFQGRYGGQDPAMRSNVISTLRDRIQRVRGTPGGFGETWQIPTETLDVPADPWVGRLSLIAVSAVVGACLLWFFFRGLLASATTPLAGLVP